MPTDHKQWEELIPDYITGRLSESEMESVRQHQASCGQCSRLMQELQPLFSALEVEGSREAPPWYFSSLVPRLRDRLGAPTARRTPRPFADLALPLASLALLLMIALTIGPLWQERTSADPALSAAVGDISADALADAVAKQAEAAGIVEGSSEGSFAGALPDGLVESEIVKTLLQDRSITSGLEVPSGPNSLWLPDLSETEVTTLLKRLSERELL